MAVGKGNPEFFIQPEQDFHKFLRHVSEERWDWKQTNVKNICNFFKISGLGIRAFVSYWVILVPKALFRPMARPSWLPVIALNFLHILILFPIVMLKFSPSFDTNTLWFFVIIIFNNSVASWSKCWMERLLVLGNIRRRRYLLLNIFRVKMDILLFPEFFHSSRAVACSASNFSICASSFSGFGRAFTPSSFRASLLVMWSSYSFWCCPR